MAVPNQYVAATKAVGAGSLVGSALPSIATVLVGLSMVSENPGEALLLAAFPLMVTLACASVGFLVVVLPLTAVLKRRQTEGANTYSLFSGIGGAGMPVLVFFVFGGTTSGILLGLFGLITGASVGHFWWKWGRKPIVETTDADTAAVFE